MTETPPVLQVEGAEILRFPRIPDHRGNLTFVEQENHVPFDLQRVYYLYDVPGGETRGGHALKTTDQVLIAMSGSFDVVLDDGERRDVVTLNRSYFGLYLPPLTWRELENFSSGSVCLGLTSKLYEEDDYIRTYREFATAVRGSAGSSDSVQ